MEVHNPLTHQLDTLLNDSEGVQQFHRFLSSSFSSGHLLDFWFACKGFRSIVDGDDQLKLLQVAKAIYRTYIKSDAAFSVPVNDSTKREIRSTLAAFSQSVHKSSTGDKCLPVLRSLFDSAQLDIQHLLARSYFLDFLKSDSFRKIHQWPALLECSSSFPTKSHNRSYYEQADSQLRGTGKNRARSESRENAHGTDRTSQNPTPAATDQNASETGIFGFHAKLSTGSSEKSRRTTTGDAGPDLVTASDLIACMQPVANGNNNSNNPVISDAIAAATKPSSTDAANNHNTRKPGTNLAEIDPSAFAQTLSHRLEKVKESRGKMERLLSRMQPLDTDDTSCGDDPELVSIHAASTAAAAQKVIPPPPPPARPTRLSSASRRSASTSASSGGGELMLRKKLAALLPTNPPTTGTDDAQVILEDHCSRIWTDESKQHIGPLNVVRKGGGGRRSDVYSISSFDSGVGTYGGGGGVNSSDSESCVSRGHHHHHHQHNYRWNYAAAVPPVCSFCRRTPSMSSTPAPDRKEAGGGSNYRWIGGVAYHRMGPTVVSSYQHQQLEATACRTMRSRSLTSDSTSVFDSGLSSTYDHLPPPLRRSRHDEHKLSQNSSSLHGATPTLMHVPRPPNQRSGDDYILPGDQFLPRRRSITPASFSTSTNSPLHGGGSGGGPFPPPPRPERQKYPPLPLAPSEPTTRCTDSALLKTAPLPHFSSHPASGCNLVVGYYLCDDPVPYRTVWTGPVVESPSSTSPSITLGQFKQLVAKKGVYRYFFKTASDDFGTGCVHEEVGDENLVLPLWEGKVIARVERAD